MITGDDVFVRSGPGTDYYQCGKLLKGDRVTVVKEEGGWSLIVPPLGSFSWIHMQYICVSLNDRTEGVVTGDQVPVYAGSELVAPIHSTTRQVVLRRGDKVKLLGEERDGYLKIACPAGAGLWVSSRYIRPITDQPASRPTQTVAKPTQQEVGDAYRMDEFNKLLEQFNAETAKPLTKQDFTAIKRSLQSIVDDKKATKASLYARLLLARIANCEVAKQAQVDLEKQEKALADALAKIEKSKQDQLKLTPDISRFCVVGRLERSSLYDDPAGPRRCKVVADDGSLLCFAQASQEASGQDMEALLGQKVGLVGTIKPNPATGTALVEFTEAVKLP
jgi:uncharacterized protein YgiM (DUF1202 family)